MTNLNGDFDKLCAELQRMVMEELALPDLISLRKTRMENNEGVKDYMEDRRRKLYEVFVKDVDKLKDLMERTGTVVSGSSALHLFQPKPNVLRLQDLDVYATEEFSQKVLNHFKDDEEYEVTNTVKWRRDYNSSAISRVHKLEKNGKLVDVIITNWASAIIPVLQYHSTIVMNYMTAHTFISLYPEWTKAGKSLVNPAVYMGEKSNLQTVLALMKYIRRGFYVSAEPFDMGIHNCDQSTYCPRTTRTTIDEGTPHWEFEVKNTVGKTVIVCNNMAVIEWCLRGEGCKDENEESVAAHIAIAA
ncbi:hypothetical protein DFJ58DRAFT_847082 [Suillus subalutaceus]|uniref:uncharacterized protein n=1 Tax=Suillus subalutaceus TaxID=48586 RepID=UPI001B85D32A|nr:uncharacterized protein DFJ58DRAFT_847082 [Suillus subalutaceus]KAG1836196.1 hypothetical protein DFJ58DRAFT_847082 [Suillus subalutaceus]